MGAITTPAKWRRPPSGSWEIAAEWRNRVILGWSASSPRQLYDRGAWRTLSNTAPPITPAGPGFRTTGDGANQLQCSIAELGSNLSITCVALIHSATGDDTTASGGIVGVYGSSTGALGLSEQNYRNRIQAAWRYGGGAWTAGQAFDHEFTKVGLHPVAAFHSGTIGGLYSQGTGESAQYDPAGSQLSITGSTTFYLNGYGGGDYLNGATAGVQLAFYLRGVLGYSGFMGWAANPYQFFAPLRRRLYSFSAGGAGQTIAVGQVTETDLAQAIAHLKTKAIGQVAETDLAQALTAAKRLAIGQVTESSLAQPITAAKRAAVSQATETDTAQAIARAKAKQLGQTTETDLAQTITASGNKIIAVGQIAETDTAQAITPAKAKLLGQTTETDTAQAISRAKAKQLSQTTETDLAQAITPSVPNQVGQTTETDTAQSLTARKTKTLGQIAESDVAQAVTHAKTKGLGLALEIDLGQPITWAPKRRILGQALETDLAQAITAALSSTLLPKGKLYTVGPRAGFVVGARNSFRVDQ